MLAVDLGSASSFAVLAGSGITIAGPTVSTINGDIGAFPTATITGMENAVLSGINYGGNGITQAAKLNLVDAYNDAASRSADFTYSDGSNLSGTLAGGVHQSAGSFLINGTLTLDGGGDSNTVWIFQSGSTLLAASGSQIILINGAQASNVFWQVGSSATIGTTTDFSGTILADQSITLNTGAILNGRALALNAAVTLDTNTITVPEPSAVWLFGAASISFFARRRR